MDAVPFGQIVVVQRQGLVVVVLPDFQIDLVLSAGRLAACQSGEAAALDS